MKGRFILSILFLCGLFYSLRSEVLRDIRFQGQELDSLGIVTKNYGDFAGIITPLAKNIIDGEMGTPILLANPTMRSWTALVFDLEGLNLPPNTRVRLTAWVKTNVPDCFRVAISAGVSYGGECHSLSRQQASHLYIRQAVSVEHTLKEANVMVSAACGIDYHSEGTWAAVDRILLETVEQNTPILASGSPAPDYEELFVPKDLAMKLPYNWEALTASAQKELACYRHSGLQGEFVQKRQAFLEKLEQFVHGEASSIDVVSLARDLQSQSLQMQLLPEMTPLTDQDAIAPITSEFWHARASKGGHDGALLVVSNRTAKPLTCRLSVSGKVTSGIVLERLQWVGGYPDCAVPIALDTFQDFPPDSLVCFALTFDATQLESGIYDGELELASLDASFPVRKIPLQFNVLAWEMPSSMPIRTFLNDYGLATEDDLAPLMKRGRVNTVQFHHQGRDLSRIEPLTRKMKENGLREGAFVYVEEWFTREEGWHEQDNKWLDQLVATMETNGWNYNEWCLHIFDETLSDLFLECAKAIKAHNPNVQIFSDHLVSEVERLRQFAPYLDFFCPKLDTQTGEARERYFEAMKFLRSTGKPIWIYDCDSMSSHPIDHSRILAWLAWLDNDQGILFWSLIPSNLRSHSAAQDFGLTYQLGDRKYPSRRLQMWFAGLEDYLLLEEAAKIDFEQTRQLAQRVVDAFRLGENRICQAHFAARQELLDIIAGLFSDRPHGSRNPE